MHGLEKDVQPLVDLYKKNNEAKWVKNHSPMGLYTVPETSTIVL